MVDARSNIKVGSEFTSEMDFAIFPSSIYLQCRGDAQDAKIRECPHWDGRMFPVTVWRVLAAALGLALVPAQYQVTRSDPLARLAGVLRSAKSGYIVVGISILSIIIIYIQGVQHVWSGREQSDSLLSSQHQGNNYINKIDIVNIFAKISIMQKSKYLFISCLMHN